MGSHFDRIVYATTANEQEGFMYELKNPISRSFIEAAIETDASRTYSTRC